MQPRPLLRCGSALVALLLLSACSDPRGGGEDVAERSEQAPDKAGGAWRVRLDQDSPSYQQSFDALSPPDHTIDVVLTFHRGAMGDVAVDLETETGALLQVRPGPDECSSRPGELICHTLFPRLEAQKAGRWNVNAQLLGRSPVDFTVAVIFESV